MKKYNIMKYVMLTACMVVIFLVIKNRFDTRTVINLVLLWGGFFVYQDGIAKVFLYKSDRYAREKWFIAYFIGWILTCGLNILLIKSVV